VAERDRAAPMIYCIEAVSANVERLQHNIELNGLEETILAIAKGVGDIEKEVQIQIEGNLKEGEGTGTANILSDHSDHPAERVPLAITTLDNLIEKGLISREVSLIKIDVDGYDLNVLKGAKNMLSRSRPVIFGEFMEYCLAWHGQSYTDVIEYVTPLNYRVYKRENNGFMFSDKDFVGYSSDLLIVPEEKIGAVEWCTVQSK
jgi:FkbM family methyltransferase